MRIAPCVLSALLVTVFACTDQAPGPSLPDATEDDLGAPEDDFEFDIFEDPTLDETPLNTLTFLQSGTWLLDPPGGPYSSVTGTLEMMELFNDQPNPNDPLGDDDARRRRRRGR